MALLWPHQLYLPPLVQNGNPRYLINSNSRCCKRGRYDRSPSKRGGLVISLSREGCRSSLVVIPELLTPFLLAVHSPVLAEYFNPFFLFGNETSTSGSDLCFMCWRPSSGRIVSAAAQFPCPGCRPGFPVPRKVTWRFGSVTREQHFRRSKINGHPRIS